MRLLLFNLMTDEQDPVLGFACNWIRQLAPHCDYIDVLTMYHGNAKLPDNVRVFSAGRELGLVKPARLLRFYRHLLRLLATRQYDACFAHMMPLFAGLAGPLLTARGIPTALWYTHRQRSAQLRLGLLMSRTVLSAHASNFPYPTDKLCVIGHGIDTDFYTPASNPTTRPDGRPLVLQVARLAAIKHQSTTIQAIAETEIETELALIGAVQAGYPQSYQQQLQGLSQQHGISERCLFTGDLPPAQVRDWYHRATVAVNMSPRGLFDKAALESMACAVPTLVCNPAFALLLGDYQDLLLTDGPNDVAGLRQRLLRLLQLSPTERAAIGSQLRQNVVEAHSLTGLTGRLLTVLRTGELPRNP